MKQYYVTLEVRLLVDAATPTDAGKVVSKAMAGVGFDFAGPNGFMDNATVQGTTLVNLTEEYK